MFWLGIMFKFGLCLLDNYVKICREHNIIKTTLALGEILQTSSTYYGKQFRIKSYNQRSV